MDDLLQSIPNGVFVFGSNLMGKHGAGAAKDAHLHWGAQWGVGYGRTGMAYALPTKDRGLQTRRLEDIQDSMNAFVHYVKKNPELLFLVTPVGCGLAGLQEHTVIDMLRKAGGPTRNMLFTASWVDSKVF